MINRSILAAILALSTGTGALAEVQVKTPGVQVQAPSGGVNLDVNVGGKILPGDAWIGRAVYSSDDKNVGEISSVSGDQVYADIGGFLGIGETRVLLTPDKIASVKNDRIVLKLTENEAKNLPPVDDKPAAK
jgi:hypothetical protein